MSGERRMKRTGAARGGGTEKEQSRGMIDYPRAIAIECDTGTSGPKFVVQPLRRSSTGRLVGGRGHGLRG